MKRRDLLKGIFGGAVAAVAGASVLTKAAGAAEAVADQTVTVFPVGEELPPVTLVKETTNSAKAEVDQTGATHSPTKTNPKDTKDFVETTPKNFRSPKFKKTTKSHQKQKGSTGRVWKDRFGDEIREDDYDFIDPCYFRHENFRNHNPQVVR